MSTAMFAKYSIVCFENPLVNVLLNSYGIKVVKDFTNSKNSKQFQIFWENAVKEITFFTYPMAVMLFYYASAVIEILFSEKFISAAVVFQIYALVSIVRPLPYQALLRMENLVKYNMIISILFVAFALIIVWIVSLFSSSLLMLSLSYFGGWIIFNIFAIYFLHKHRSQYNLLHISGLKIISFRLIQAFPLGYIVHHFFAQNFWISILIYGVMYTLIIFIFDSHIRNKILNIVHKR
jgi:O-antigen/teichoic acid export membrane protein